jgi:hypothetical protein
MTTEATIQTALQGIIQGMAAFADADVVINDFSVFDRAIAGAPYAIISAADDFDSRQDTQTPNTTWWIKLTLVEEWTEWSTALDNLVTRRQAIIDELNTDDNRTADGIAGFDIPSIRNDGPILAWYEPYVSADEAPEAMPVFLFQDLLLECKEF